ncbi:hypothetical protein H0H93_008021, partial [Arthromyces matolae]
MLATPSSPDVSIAISAPAPPQLQRRRQGKGIRGVSQQVLRRSARQESMSSVTKEADNQKISLPAQPSTRNPKIPKQKSVEIFTTAPTTSSTSSELESAPTTDSTVSLSASGTNLSHPNVIADDPSRRGEESELEEGEIREESNSETLPHASENAGTPRESSPLGNDSFTPEQMKNKDLATAQHGEREQLAQQLSSGTAANASVITGPSSSNPSIVVPSSEPPQRKLTGKRKRLDSNTVIPMRKTVMFAQAEDETTTPKPKRRKIAKVVPEGDILPTETEASSQQQTQTYRRSERQKKVIVTETPEGLDVLPVEASSQQQTEARGKGRKKKGDAMVVSEGSDPLTLDSSPQQQKPKPRGRGRPKKVDELVVVVPESSDTLTGEVPPQQPIPTPRSRGRRKNVGMDVQAADTASVASTPTKTLKEPKPKRTKSLKKVSFKLPASQRVKTVRVNARLFPVAKGQPTKGEPQWRVPKWNSSHPTRKKSKTVPPEDAIVKPRFWCSSKEELVSAQPELSKAVNDIAWVLSTTPVIFLEDDECNNIVVSDLLDGGLSFEMKMTRDFVCLPADLVDPDEALIDKPTTSDDSPTEAPASEAPNTNVEQGPSVSKQPPPVLNPHAEEQTDDLTLDDSQWLLNRGPYFKQPKTEHTFSDMYRKTSPELPPHYGPEHFLEYSPNAIDASLSTNHSFTDVSSSQPETSHPSFQSDYLPFPLSTRNHASSYAKNPYNPNREIPEGSSSFSATHSRMSHYPTDLYPPTDMKGKGKQRMPDLTESLDPDFWMDVDAMASYDGNPFPQAQSGIIQPSLSPQSSGHHKNNHSSYPLLTSFPQRAYPPSMHSN